MPQPLHSTQYTRSTYLPELLASILASHSLQDLRSTRVFIHETSHLVNIVVDDNVQALLDATGFLHLVGCELLRHCGLRWAGSGFEMWFGWMRSRFVWVGPGTKCGCTSISFYLYQVSWANVNVVVVLPRIWVLTMGD